MHYLNNPLSYLINRRHCERSEAIQVICLVIWIASLRSQ